MKQKILLIFGFGLFFLLGCNTHLTINEMVKIQATEFQPMQQHWYGLLPCNDCDGLETILFLKNTGRFSMHQSYRHVIDHSQVIIESAGSWARTADTLVLTKNDGSRIFFQVKNDSIEMITDNSVAGESTTDYKLYPNEKP